MGLAVALHAGSTQSWGCGWLSPWRTGSGREALPEEEKAQRGLSGWQKKTHPIKMDGAPGQGGR